MDRVARELDMDPAEVRRRNFILNDEYPYNADLDRDNNPLEYDSGDYPACLEEALKMIGYDDFRKAQLAERKRGARLGVGIAAYVEGTGFGPYEGGNVKVGTDGKFYVFTGAASQGQGQEPRSARSAPTILASTSKTSMWFPATARRFLTASELSPVG